MNTLHFTPNFNAPRMNFDEVLETASNLIIFNDNTGKITSYACALMHKL